MFNANIVDAPPLLKEYLNYMMAIKGRSAKTCEGYYIDLRLFLRYIKQQRYNIKSECENLSDIIISDIPSEMIAGVNISDAYSFLNYTMNTNNNKASARSRKVSSIKGFYKYITDKTDLLKTNPMEKLETPSKRKSLPKFLTLEESKQLLSSIKGKNEDRDYCMITFLLNCGMRVSELVSIKTFSFVTENSLKIIGKGNKERIVFLNDACLDAKEKYLATRVQSKIAEYKDYFFTSSSGKPLTTRRVEQILEHHLSVAGLSGKGISPHKLRHTAATLMYQHGNVDIRVLKDILGHANLGTTEIYTHISDKQLENAAAASPLAGIKKKPSD